MACYLKETIESPLCHVLFDPQLLYSGFCSQPPHGNLLFHGHPGAPNSQKQLFFHVLLDLCIVFEVGFLKFATLFLEHAVSPTS